MKGRDLFQRYNYLLKFIAKIFGLFPNFICKFLWDAISPFSGYLFTALRYCILSSRGKIGSNVYIGTYVVFKNWSKFICGDNLSIHDFCYIDAIGEIEIGNDVSIAHGSSLVSFNHTFGNSSLPIKYNEVLLGKIEIKDDVWIGSGVRILSGVSIGERSVIAAGAVINKNVINNSLVGGVPAKLIKVI